MWKRLPFRLRGYLITMTGVLLLSPDALLIKDTQAGVATFMFWRGLLLGSVLLLIATLRYRSRLPGAIRACGAAAWWCPLAFAGSAWAFVGAARLTAAGNVLVMMNLAPLVAGLIGMVVFGQRLRRQTWVVIAVCVTGACLMAAGEIGQGSPLGLAIALFVPISIAVNTTVASVQRGDRQRGVDTTVVLPLGCLAMLVPAVLLGGVQLPPPEDVSRLALLALFLPAAYFLIQTGPRYLPGAEVSLVMLLETLVGALLVWWWLDEVPPPLAFVGGGMIVAAMLTSGLRDLHRQRRKAAAGAPDERLLQEEAMREAENAD
ncbi:DMT family transporter [Halomonas elongata]|uniref:DMT family transporter n=1 Tax=Halomonas elongata (strain ATCC 33173 / DSM 2581 / NBRC 15536 / NCIMB 2198 / 1H9) TaxID=768066 RepID=E1V5C0_HALED|nr:DMT family transporter [Halomonas elongata]WPU45647.1 DMT family transporter [Halomonas elongata DSM 2581]WVI70491.1 DMT family transporter [Halomonas elongata]CBV43075.1 DMT superfamily transport protein [Halomonas elongata DSM 2581]